ncbi:MAG: bifunctional riboflavin kinase/FAD synthetase [Candidatus Acidiferrales bacterium]
MMPPAERNDRNASRPPAFAVFNSPEEWTARLGAERKRTAVTIGNFDGVHLGHRRILRGVIERSLETDTLSTVLTFFPHPARILRPELAPPLLMTLPQRLEAFCESGVDATLVLRFDAELAKVSAEDFVQRLLVDALRARAVMVGGNFRFGHKQTGDVNLLEELGRRWDFEVQVVPPVVQEGVVVSSTAVREAVREGRMDLAAKLLGRRFALAGEIQTGTGQGRKLVVPTLNLATEQECLPKNGVYATESVAGVKTYRSVTNIGVRPTFDGQRLAIESHLFDFSETLTSGPMEVCFWKRLRDERKFSGPEALREQVLRDISEAQAYFASLAQPR